MESGLANMLMIKLATTLAFGTVAVFGVNVDSTSQDLLGVEGQAYREEQQLVEFEQIDTEKDAFQVDHQKVYAIEEWLESSDKVSTGTLSHPGGSEEDFDHALDVILKSHKLVVLSKIACPFSKDTKAMLKDIDPQQQVDSAIFELDTSPDMSSFQDAMQRKTGTRTVPAVFFEGKRIGGHDETMAMKNKGELQKLLHLPQITENSTSRHHTASKADQAQNLGESVEQVDMHTQNLELVATRLDTRTFEQYLQEKKAVMVDIYKNGCHSCAQLDPKLDEAAAMLATEPYASVGKVEASSSIADKYDKLVKGYPTLILFKDNGRSYEVYDGPKSAVGIANAVLAASKQ